MAFCVQLFSEWESAPYVRAAFHSGRADCTSSSDCSLNPGHVISELAEHFCNTTSEHLKLYLCLQSSPCVDNWNISIYVVLLLPQAIFSFPHLILKTRSWKHDCCFVITSFLPIQTEETKCLCVPQTLSIVSKITRLVNGKDGPLTPTSLTPIQPSPQHKRSEYQQHTMEGSAWRITELTEPVTFRSFLTHSKGTHL
jgi:hypothetical protein